VYQEDVGVERRVVLRWMDVFWKSQPVFYRGDEPSFSSFVTELIFGFK